MQKEIMLSYISHLSGIKYNYRLLKVEYNHGHELGKTENYPEKHAAFLTVGKMVEESNVSKPTVRYTEIIWKGCRKEVPHQAIPQNAAPNLCQESLEQNEDSPFAKEFV